MSTVRQVERIVKRLDGVLTVESSATIAAASKKMIDNEVSCLLVMEASAVAGIVTERDVVTFVAAGSDPAATIVQHIMSTSVVSCTMDTPINKAQNIMAAHSIRHLPIIENGVPLGMISIRDFLAYQLYEANAKLLSARKEAEEAFKAEHSLLSSVSYEIRTPMNGILGMTELALDTSLTPEQRDYLGIVKTSAETLMSVVTNLFDFSQMESGKIELDKTPFNIRQTVRSAIRSLMGQADSKNLHLSCHVQPMLPECTVGDPERLGQIIVNLVENAIKYTNHGEVSVKIELDSQNDDSESFHFTVSDTGAGLTPEQQADIFQPMQRLDDFRRRCTSGTGLGLAIAARLVELMGGKMWVESEPGKGSNFHFTAAFTPVASRVMLAGK